MKPAACRFKSGRPCLRRLCRTCAGLLPELGALLDVLGSGGEERRGQQVAIRERALRILSRVAARCLCLQASRVTSWCTVVATSRSAPKLIRSGDGGAVAHLAPCAHDQACAGTACIGNSHSTGGMKLPIGRYRATGNTASAVALLEAAVREHEQGLGLRHRGVTALTRRAEEWFEELPSSDVSDLRLRVRLLHGRCWDVMALQLSTDRRRAPVREVLAMWRLHWIRQPCR